MSANRKEEFEEPMDLSVRAEFTVMTGGAEGTDALAESCARHVGMQVELKIPPGHPRAIKVTPVPEGRLKEADDYLREAAFHLKRRVSGTPYTLNLLRRNYAIVKEANALYAFGRFEDVNDPCTLSGGTGCTVQLAVEINRVFAGKPKAVFVYDKYHRAWFELVTHQDRGTAIAPFRFVRKETPPLLDKSSAVVGSRTLDDRTAKEIVGLFGRTADEERRHRDDVRALKEQMRAFHVTPGDPQPMNIDR